MTAIVMAIGNTLKAHVGSEHAISAPALADQLGYSERVIRRVISEEYVTISQLAGGLLCSKPGAGFYVSTHAEDIIAKAEWIKQRERGIEHEKTTLRQALHFFGLDALIAPEPAKAA